MEYIVEYKSYWFDCDSEWDEQTLNIKADSIEDAEKIGKDEIAKLNINDNKFMSDPEFNPCVSHTFKRCVLSDEFSYISSAKEPPLNGFGGYIDVTKWNGF